eukprot:5688630-Pyramimonas_sp.AAC.1
MCSCRSRGRSPEVPGSIDALFLLLVASGGRLKRWKTSSWNEWPLLGLQCEGVVSAISEASKLSGPMTSEPWK